MRFVPTAAGKALLLIVDGRGVVVPFTLAGGHHRPAPAIGFRPAALSQVTLDCVVNDADLFPVKESGGLDHASYLAIALGAGDYLARRAREHAAGRVQFPGQMLDTEGRDGIAKLGAVKALVARVEAWRLLLETLYLTFTPHSALRTPHSDHLSSSLAALAFSPENGAMAYDAGQVFGGFAFSEDDLLSRFYRDSSLFRYLSPGYGAADALHADLSGKDLDNVLADELGSLSGISGSPVGSLRRSGTRRGPRVRTSPQGPMPGLPATRRLCCSVSAPCSR